MPKKRSAPDNWIRFGKWIAKKRESRGLSQEDAGKLADPPLHKQTWYSIEKGQPSKRATVIAMAVAVGANVDEALTEAGFQPLYNQPLSGGDLLLSYFNTLPEERGRDLLNIAKMMAEEYAPKPKPEHGRKPRKSRHQS